MLCCSFWLAKVIPFLVCQSTILFKSKKPGGTFKRKRAEREKNLRENSFENFKWPHVVTSDLASEINEFPSCQNVN